MGEGKAEGTASVEDRSSIEERSAGGHGGRAERARGTRTGWTRRRRAWAAFGLLVVVCVAFAVQHSALFPPTRPVLWDEAVYISQVTPGMHGVFFNAWHARGITLIIAPVTSLGGWIDAIRIYLTVLSALATVAAFGLWLRLLGVSAAIAAAGFSFSWVTLISASRVMPNYWATLLAVATAAMVARWIQEERPRQIVGASALLAGMALVRPTDALLVAAGLIAYVLVFRRQAWRGIGWLIGGLIAGWAPWVIEMSVRFGGPMGAIHEAGKAEHYRLVHVTKNVLRHLAFAGGTEGASAAGGAIWWGVVLALSLVAIVRVRSEERTAAFVCSSCALFLGAQYLLIVPAFTPRFLLPAFALATIPAAIGLRSLLRGGYIPRAAAVVVGLLAIPWVVWQVGVAEERVPEATFRTVPSAYIGTTMRALSEGRPCFFMSRGMYPALSIASRCQGTRYRRIPTLAALGRLARDGGRDVFLVVGGGSRRGEAELREVVSPIQVPSKPYWRLYHFRPEMFPLAGT